MTLTDTANPRPPTRDEDLPAAASRLLAIKAAFFARGTVAYATDHRIGLDVDAVVSRSGSPGEREAELWVHEDGYVELRYESPPGASAEQIVNIALRALRAATSPLTAVPPPRPP
jgi:hypothetical protein